MELYPRLYIGESVKNPDKLIHKLQKHAKFLEAYVIILARNTSDQLEIHKAGYLSQKYYRENPPYVIGIAGNYDEAVCLVQKIAEEAFAIQGDCRLKEYLKCYM
ncbi:MAG: hypothetical protein UFG06_02215 [Lachnospiraceae bacterium]|nr:hypothetical protein [Lachnospiraceae bacterium]